MEQSHLFEKIHRHFSTLIGGYFQGLSPGNIADYIVPASLGGMSGEYGALALAQNSFDERLLKK